MLKPIKILVSLIVLSLLMAACGPAETAAPTTAATEVPQMTETTEATEPATTAPGEATATEPSTASGEIDCKGAQSGDTVSMLYQWAGEEEARLTQILQPLVDACGIVLQPETTRDQGLLDTRVQAALCCGRRK